MIAKINLAPEVYQNSQRNKQRKRVATTLAIIISSVAGAMVVVALVVYVGQTGYLAVVNSDIKKSQQKLDTNSNLISAVTTQQHLTAVVGLYGSRTYISRFFKNLEQISPAGVALESLQIDSANNVTLSGTSGSFNLATKFAKALQADNTEIGDGAAPGQPPYFTNIDLASADAGPTGKVSFKITATMAPVVVAAPATNTPPPATPQGSTNGL